MTLLPIDRPTANAAVEQWHSHHKPRGTLPDKLRIGGFVDDRLVAAVVVGAPIAPELARVPTIWEVTRLAVGPDAPHCAASRLLGAAWRASEAHGIRRLVSYTRIDEAGTCYRAAGWVATAIVDGREHTTGNRALRWLPGLYEPSTEIIDRVRWEIGPDAATTRVRVPAGKERAA